MSWKLYEETREPPETDIAHDLELNFSLFEPWEQRDPDPARATVTKSTKTGTNDVDSMMLYIQAMQREGKANIDDPAKIMPPGGQVNGGVAARNTKLNAKYFCKVPSCNKAFHQRRHLEIHLRSHTGERPYRCSYPGCGRSFSQQCNLKTHSRLHTGEKPFVCTLCGKSFSQKGNLTQHQLIHDSERQFVCRLDGCEKRFTQLGNLKAHHNTSHSDTLKKFTERLQGVRVPEMSATELELFEYFKSLYKNSNRGIRGRGKGTKNTRQVREPQYQLPKIAEINRGQLAMGAKNAADGLAPQNLISTPSALSWNFPGANILTPTHPTPQPVRAQEVRAQDQPFPPIAQQPSIKKLLNQSEESLPPFYVMERWKP